MRISTRTAAIATVVLGLAGIAATTVATEAHAGPGINLPIECEFASTWTKKACTVQGNTFPANYSVKQINAQPKYSKVRAAVAELCADDTFMQMPYAKYVRKGDTLWSIAVKAYGNGHQYKAIQKLNGLRSTAIKPGQWLIVKPLPAECRAVNPYAR